MCCYGKALSGKADCNPVLSFCTQFELLHPNYKIVTAVLYCFQIA